MGAEEESANQRMSALLASVAPEVKMISSGEQLR